MLLTSALDGDRPPRCQQSDRRYSQFDIYGLWVVKQIGFGMGAVGPGRVFAVAGVVGWAAVQDADEAVAWRAQSLVMNPPAEFPQVVDTELAVLTTDVRYGLRRGVVT